MATDFSGIPDFLDRTKAEAKAKAKSWRDVISIHPAADLFPLMEGAELAALVEDVWQHGLRIPMVLWEDVSTGEQSLIAGRNRLRAMIASGRELHDHYFHVVGHCESTRDPYAYVISENIHRRHLTPEQKRDLIAKLIKAAPEKSDRQIADTVKASPTTVGTVRAKMEAAGDVSKLDTRQDTKGRKQPARKTAKPSTPKSDPEVDKDRKLTRREAKQIDQVLRMVEQMSDEVRSLLFIKLKEMYSDEFHGGGSS